MHDRWVEIVLFYFLYFSVIQRKKTVNVKLLKKCELIVIKIHSLLNSLSEIILLFTPRVVITNFPLNLRETPLVVIQ